MSALPFPLPRVVDEKYVILPIINGLARDEVLHLPATVTTYSIYEGKRDCTIRFDVRMRDGFSPESWPSACGQVEKGSVYVQGGVLERVPVCTHCLTALREGDPPAPIVSGRETTDVAAAPTGEQPSPSLSLVKPTLLNPDRRLIMSTCKIDGCSNEAPSRGRFARHCPEHRPTRATTAKPQAVPVPEVPAAPVADLAGLAAEMETARTELADAQHRYDTAVAAFRDHPTVRELAA